MPRNALDPAGTAARHRITLSVLGVPVRLEADAAAILAAAERALGYPHFTAGPARDVRPDGAGSPVIRLVLGPAPLAGNRRLAVDGTRQVAPLGSRQSGLAGSHQPAVDGGRQLAVDGDRQATRPVGRQSGLAGSREPRGGPRLHVRTDHRRRLVLRASGVVAFANLRRLEAMCALEPGILEDRELFGEVLDTLTLMLVNRLDRQPVHAAAVELNGRAAVLAGPSGTGKSTIAYAALRAGLRVLDDDAVYVQLEPRFRIWGKGRRLHLTPDTARLFPELADRAPMLRPNGKWKIPVATSAASASTPPAAERALLCVLERRGGPDVRRGDPDSLERTQRGDPAALECTLHGDPAAIERTPPTDPRALERTALIDPAALSLTDQRNSVNLERIDADEAIAHLVGGLEPGFRAFRDTIEPRLRALARGGVWRLRLSDDPNAAVACIRQLLTRPEP